MKFSTNNSSTTPPEVIELPYRITEATSTQKTISVYISEHLDSAEMYVELLDKLRNTSPQDIVYIYLNTAGGYIDTGIQLINAMKDCKARVITVLDGTVCSMGALIYLAADEYIVHDNCRLMFHNYSGGTYGKGHEQIAELASSVDWYTQMFAEICFPFLSEEEIEEVIVGQDLWLSSDDIRERMETVVEYMEQLTEEAEAEAATELAKTRKKELLAELKKIETNEKRETNKLSKTKSKGKKKVGKYKQA